MTSSIQSRVERESNEDGAGVERELKKNKTIIEETATPLANEAVDVAHQKLISNLQPDMAYFMIGDCIHDGHSSCAFRCGIKSRDITKMSLKLIFQQ